MAFDKYCLIIFSSQTYSCINKYKKVSRLCTAIFLEHVPKQQFNCIILTKTNFARKYSTTKISKH
jgi:hypothetical protein